MTGYGNKEKAISIKKPLISKFGGSASNEIWSKFYYLSGENFQTAPVCNSGLVRYMLEPEQKFSYTYLESKDLFHLSHFVKVSIDMLSCLKE